MIITILYILFFLACITLVGTVLLQPGKSDAGALFTSSLNSNAFGPRGTQSVLSRITIGAAVVFMLTALLLALPALNGNRSVLQTTSVTEDATPTPDANANTNASANVSTDANANLSTNSNGTVDSAAANVANTNATVNSNK